MYCLCILSVDKLTMDKMLGNALHFGSSLKLPGGFLAPYQNIPQQLPSKDDELSDAGPCYVLTELDIVSPCEEYLNAYRRQPDQDLHSREKKDSRHVGSRSPLDKQDRVLFLRPFW